MSLSTNTLRRLGTTLVLTAAIAGTAAPAALANHQDVGVTNALTQIRGAAPMPDAVDRYLRNHSRSAADDQCDAICRYLNTHAQGVSLVTDTLGGNGGMLSPEGPTTPSSFSWSAAALGAATAAVSLLVLAGATMLVLRRRRVLAV
jgi:hypothetical protein